MQKKSVLSDSVYHDASFLTDKYLDKSFLQISPSLGNFLAADWLTRSLQRKAAKRSHRFFILRRLPIRSDSFQSRFFIYDSEHSPSKETQPFRPTARALSFGKTRLQKTKQTDTFWAKRRHGAYGNIWTLALPDMPTWYPIYYIR